MWSKYCDETNAQVRAARVLPHLLIQFVLVLFSHRGRIEIRVPKFDAENSTTSWLQGDSFIERLLNLFDVARLKGCGVVRDTVSLKRSAC